MSIDLSGLEIQQMQEKGVREIKLIENTSYYIKTYLDPYRKWSPTFPPKERIDLLKNADVNWTSIEDHIKSMDYRVFLRTPYWKAITAHIKYRAGYRCQLCNSRRSLVTHHRDYHIHGREHERMCDLVALCDHCHHKFHAVKKPDTRSYTPYCRSCNANCKSDDVDSNRSLLIVGFIVLTVAYFLVFLGV